jgi:hypothetical protein
LNQDLDDIVFAPFTEAWMVNVAAGCGARRKLAEEIFPLGDKSSVNSIT